MRTDVISYVLGSENRKKIVRTIFEYPKRQWSCSSLEELTEISHATVFRTLGNLKYFSILKSFKINRKDIIYELVNNPLTKELKRIVYIYETTAKKIARDFIRKIKAENVNSALLYGSTVRGMFRPKSDIDILVILDKHNKAQENEILNKAAELSSEYNRTLAVTIIDLAEMRRERKSQYIRSVKENMEILYGKTPF